MERLLYIAFFLMLLNTIYAIALSTMLGHPPDPHESLQVLFMIIVSLPAAILLIPLHRLKDARERLIKLLRRDKSGIVTIIGFVLFVIVLMIFAFFSPILMDSINRASSYLSDPFSSYLLTLIPTMFLIGIVVSYLIYSGSGR